MKRGANPSGRDEAFSAPGQDDDRLSPVAPRTLADQVADQLRHLITSGQYKPGDRIPAERDLAIKLGVGRPVVREALRELKSQGLLVTGRGAQGTTVASLPAPGIAEPLSPLLGQGAERIIELMEIRSAVEIEAASLAARRATMEDLHILSDVLTAPGEMVSPEDDVAFHAAIGAATHNPLFERVIREPVDLLHDHMAAILSVFYNEPGGASTIQHQHDAIRRAIRTGNEQQAREAMRQHLDYVTRGLAQLVGTGRVMRLIFIDLDGTLLSGPRHMSERVRRAITAVREGGVEVVLVSSRPPRVMRPFHQRLGLSAPLVACNGALLWNVQAGAGLAHVPLEPEIATQIVALGRELGATVNVESDDEWFADRLGDLEREAILNYEVSEPHSVGNIAEMLRAGDPIDKVFLDLRGLEKDVAATAKVTIRRVFEDQANIYEATPGVIDITARDASKAAMAQQLARRMQIPADQTMAIGDDDSDANLLRWAGIGVAMGNATPAAKAASDVITSSNLRDGVAEALEHWILGKKAAGAPASVPNPSLVTY